MTVQASLCQTWSETLKTGFLVSWLILLNNMASYQSVFSRGGIYIFGETFLKFKIFQQGRHLFLVKSMSHEKTRRPIMYIKIVVMKLTAYINFIADLCPCYIATCIDIGIHFYFLNIKFQASTALKA